MGSTQQSMANTLSSQLSQEPSTISGLQDRQIEPRQTQHLSVQQHQVQHTQDTNGLPSAPTDLSVTASQKRKPGRPKGTGKKQLERAQMAAAGMSEELTPRRPVGRPRKDGLPAGSLGQSPRPTRGYPPVTDLLTKPPASTTGFFGGPSPPQWPVFSSMSASAPIAHIDPSLSRSVTNPADDWATLALVNPLKFLSELLLSIAAPNPPSAAGLSVEEAFKSHLNSLNSQPTPSAVPNQQPASIPSLYSIMKTFWLPSSPSYFSLTASASTARTPSEHRFLYWDPQPLVFNGIPCPCCASPLQNKGRIRTGPIKIYDIEKPYYIIGCEYVCTSGTCTASSTNGTGRHYASTDPIIMRSLPARLRDELRVVMTEYGELDMDEVWCWTAVGVSRTLWDMVRGCLRAGLGKEAILGVLRCIRQGLPDTAVPPGHMLQQGGPPKNGEDDEEEEEEEEDEDGTGQGDAEGEPDDEIPEGQQVGDMIQSPAVQFDNSMPYSRQPHPPGPPEELVVAPLPDSLPPHSPDSRVMSPQQGPPFSSFPGGPIFPPHSQPPFPFTAFPFVPQHPYYTPHPQVPPSSGLNGLKRPADGELPGIGGKKTRTRHCCKCGSQDCKGKGGRAFCQSPCQDCGKLDCKGRNSRRPDKRCFEAWDL